ncbi:MAG: HAMP domain-containing protein [Gammaproteobacteria bacterium]|nr:HAMP domain-containing protein [Gammaproteobacteria bacterium]
MRFGITFKLFAAILATSIVVVAVMMIAQRISFTRGFLDYAGRVEAVRLESLTAGLAKSWARERSWAFVQGDGPAWRRLLHERLRAGPRVRLPPARHAADHPPGPSPRRGDDDDGRRSDLFHLGPRLTLLDAGRNYVAGAPNPPADATLRAIESGGTTVGWLAVAPLRKLTSKFDLRFEAQQRRAAFASSAFALLLAAIVAVLMARHFLRPVHRLTRGTRALAAGDFSTRIATTGSDELGRLAHDFNLLARTLEKNEQARRSFMADVSHELRTPLAVLRGEIEALEDGVRVPTPEALASLRAEVHTLGKLVDDLYDLALSDVGALTYQRREVDVAQVLETTAAGFQDSFAAHGLTLRIEVPPGPRPRVFADAGRLQQLFNNLLENSLRYTDPGGRLEIRCAYAGEQLRIDFQDTAPGVPADAMGHLFERLFRVERSRSRSHGGAGLGLAICRNVVEAHGGRIEARASPLGGLWLAISLPLAGAATGPGT